MYDDQTGTSGLLVSVDSQNRLRLGAGNGAAFTFLQSAATISVGETHVLTAWDDGTNINVQIDNGAVASVARPAIAAGSVGFTIAKNIAAATEFFNGRIYGMVHRFGTPVDAPTRERVKRYMAARAGVTL
jgi:hypothetical protein